MKPAKFILPILFCAIDRSREFVTRGGAWFQFATDKQCICSVVP
jgi:hypothetical protein